MVKTHKPLTAKHLTAYALFAALTAICSQIIIPLPFTPVPVNLATMVVLLAGGLLGASGGAWSIGVYLLLGCAGVPVFTGFRGGLSVLVGPTGGYLAGYLLAAITVGLVIGQGKEKKLPTYLVAMTAGTVVCYTLGTAWFMLLTGNGLWASLTMCVLPFLPGDALKIAGASVLAQRVRKAAGNLLPQ